MPILVKQESMRRKQYCLYCKACHFLIQNPKKSSIFDISWSMKLQVPNSFIIWYQNDLEEELCYAFLILL